MVTRWIRYGKLRGTRTENRKDGYLIEEDDLYEFNDRRNPGNYEGKHAAGVLFIFGT